MPTLTASSDKDGAVLLKWGLLLHKLEETPFPIAHTNEELIHNIENFNQEKYSMQVEDFLKKKGSVEDGEASVRVCNLIESIVSEKEIRG